MMDYSDSDSTNENEIEDLLHARLINDMVLDSALSSDGRELEAEINRLIQEEQLILSPRDRASLIRRLIDRVSGLGPIERYVRDERVEEIMVNGPDSIWVQYAGDAEPRRAYEVRFRDEEHVRHIIDRIVSPVGRRIDEAQPTVDARLADGSRVHAAIPPISLNGPVLTIRKFVKRDWSLHTLIKGGTIPLPIGQFLHMCVRGRLSILVSGGTNAGKTTTLNALSSHIPENERIVTIEDTAELQLNQQNIVRLEARPANIEGTGEITIRELVRNALRMRPDRIVVGECRGPEALDMLQAMNTGHPGSLTTIHANSIQDAMSRLETMVLMGTSVNLPLSAVRDQIRGAIRLVVQQSLYPDGKRRIVSIGEVLRVDPSQLASAQGGHDLPVQVRELYRFDRMQTNDQTVVQGHWVCLHKPEFLSELRERNMQIDEALVRPGVIG